MARKARKQTVEADQDVTRTHNVKARGDAIRDAMEEFYQLDVQIAAALETHVKPFREAKGDIKSKLREDYQITAEVFNARYGSYRLERKAEDASDNAVSDLIHELWEAVPIGGSVDLVSVAERASSGGDDFDNPIRTEKARNAEAKSAGFDAGSEAKNLDTNPHKAGSGEHSAWATGWREAQRKRAMSMGNGAEAEASA